MHLIEGRLGVSSGLLQEYSPAELSVYNYQCQEEYAARLKTQSRPRNATLSFYKSEPYAALASSRVYNSTIWVSKLLHHFAILFPFHFAAKYNQLAQLPSKVG